MHLHHGFPVTHQTSQSKRIQTPSCLPALAHEAEAAQELEQPLAPQVDSHLVPAQAFVPWQVLVMCNHEHLEITFPQLMTSHPSQPAWLTLSSLSSH